MIPLRIFALLLCGAIAACGGAVDEPAAAPGGVKEASTMTYAEAVAAMDVQGTKVRITTWVAGQYIYEVFPMTSPKTYKSYTPFGPPPTRTHNYVLQGDDGSTWEIFTP